MSYKDKCDLVLYMIDKVDVFWNRLYVSTAVIIGFLIGGNLIKTNIALNILLLSGYFIFLISNLIDHIRAYRYLIDLIKEIQTETDVFKYDGITRHLIKLPYKYEIYTCIAAYLGALVLNLLIWYFLKLL